MMNSYVLLSILALKAFGTYAQESIMLLKSQIKNCIFFITAKRSLRLWMLKQSKCSEDSAL